ncbi:hypothetical protein BJV77DRAFT_58978 [Russula vinacea]|nr:hypothetical protein BJV77DRAFT_58978 [Russula vinacea]
MDSLSAKMLLSRFQRTILSHTPRRRVFLSLAMKRFFSNVLACDKWAMLLYPSLEVDSKWTLSTRLQACDVDPAADSAARYRNPMAREYGNDGIQGDILREIFLLCSFTFGAFERTRPNGVSIHRRHRSHKDYTRTTHDRMACQPCLLNHLHFFLAMGHCTSTISRAGRIGQGATSGESQQRLNCRVRVLHRSTTSMMVRFSVYFVFIGRFF